MADVSLWLGRLGLEKYAKAFADNDIDLDVLPDLTDADLERLGFTLGHRKKLLKAIAALKAGNDAQTAAPELPRIGAPPAQAERRQLTVMFVDLVGSTELSLKLDPEELRELLRGYQDTLGREVARFGGHVAKYMGDGVLVYFGYPRAHEDDAVRAIYAGLAVVRAVKRLGMRMLEAHGGRLRARIGVATGVVVIGDLVGAEGSEAGAVTGETPNLAFRLQEAAGSGRVVVAERTRALAGDAFSYEEPEERKLKGFPEATKLWRVLGPSGAESRFEALHGRWLTPLVGREHELALLLDRWHQARDGDGQVVLIAGEAGIGKSRITEVLRERIMADDHVQLRFQCSPYHTNSALFPVIEHLERAAGFEREDASETKLDKLENLIGQAGAAVNEVAPLFAELLSVPTGNRYPSLVMSPERQKERTLAALADQVAGLARSKPVLMIVEDAHWIDPTTLESVDLAIARAETQRLLVVVTFRPEFIAKWVGRPNVTLITMNRLSKRQGATMVAGITGGRALPPEVLDQVVARTDGVPLFVEELTRMVVESGLLREEAGRYVLDGPLPPLAIPATLHDSLMARLDRFAPAKEVAQAAAAIGRTFGHELLAAVLTRDEADLSVALDQLVDSGLVFRQGSGAEASYTFKHALVQDAAHQSLLKSQRQRLHARIASVLEKQFSDQAAAAPEVVAQHYAEAGISESAIAWWTRAANHALEHSANIEATKHFRSGLAILDRVAENERPEKELILQIGLGSALTAIEGYSAPATGAAYQRARELCIELGDKKRLFPVLYALWNFENVAGRHTMAKRIASEMLELTNPHGDMGPRLAAHSALGTTFAFLGSWSDAKNNLDACIELYDPEKHLGLKFEYAEDPGVGAYVFRSLCLCSLGFSDQAVESSSRAVRLADQVSHANTSGFALGMLTWLHYFLGDPKAVLATAEKAIAFAKDAGLPVWGALPRVYRGWALSRLGSADEGIDETRRGIDGWRAAGAEVSMGCMHAALGDAYYVAGRYDDALREIEEGIRFVEDRQEGLWEAELYRLKGEVLLAQNADHIAEAEKCFGRALEIARDQSAKSLELRAATSLARLWAGRGERHRAHDLLAPVYSWLTEGFGTRDLIEAKALLDALV